MSKFFSIICALFIAKSTFAALEYSKVDQIGCPENAYCQKETGLIRKKWLEDLEEFNKGKLSEEKFNSTIQKENGIPISGWAQEEASILPKVMLWDSPCKQHRKETTKYYISEVFRKNLSPTELKTYSNLYFSKAFIMGNDKKVFSYTIPRGDAPLFIKNNLLYFLREEEGKYYGLLISKNGDLKVIRVESNAEMPKEGICFKEQIDAFLREAPAPNFYQGYYCKDIWDKDEKKYKTMLFGWSCN